MKSKCPNCGNILSVVQIEPQTHDGKQRVNMVCYDCSGKVVESTTLDARGRKLLIG